jgi:hypothetical protein
MQRGSEPSEATRDGAEQLTVYYSEILDGMKHPGSHAAMLNTLKIFSSSSGRRPSDASSAPTEELFAAAAAAAAAAASLLVTPLGPQRPPRWQGTRHGGKSGAAAQRPRCLFAAPFPPCSRGAAVSRSGTGQKCDPGLRRQTRSSGGSIWDRVAGRGSGGRFPGMATVPHTSSRQGARPSTDAVSHTGAAVTSSIASASHRIRSNTTGCELQVLAVASQNGAQGLQHPPGVPQLPPEELHHKERPMEGDAALNQATAIEGDHLA